MCLSPLLADGELDEWSIAMAVVMMQGDSNFKG
jgi:hypothetical protein